MKSNVMIVQKTKILQNIWCDWCKAFRTRVLNIFDLIYFQLYRCIMSIVNIKFPQPEILLMCL